VSNSLAIAAGYYLVLNINSWICRKSKLNLKKQQHPLFHYAAFGVCDAFLRRGFFLISNEDCLNNPPAPTHTVHFLPSSNSSLTLLYEVIKKKTSRTNAMPADITLAVFGGFERYQ
jgi:hypothetical protein